MKNTKFKNNATPVGVDSISAQNKDGITLIALIITIIVMLILVGVTVSVALNGGLFSTAKSAANRTQIEADREELLSAVVAAIGTDGKVDFSKLPPSGWTGSDGIYTSQKGNTFTVTVNGEIINGVKIKDLEPDKVYYADINNDGAPDGVIYADLTRGNVKSGKWTDNDGFYTIPNDLTNPKEYTVSVENYNGPLAKFGAGDVLTISGNESGNDRFYIMALEDISKNGPLYDWYNAAYGKLDNYGDDQKVFGTGKANTAKMIEYWNARRTLWRARQVCRS